MIYAYLIKDESTGERLESGAADIDTIRQRLYKHRPEVGHGHDRDDFRTVIDSYPSDKELGHVFLDWFGTPNDVIAEFWEP